MSSAQRRAEAVVERQHEPDETSCVHALNLLLKLQKAAGEDGGEDARKEIDDSDAAEIIPG